jgi:glycosyl transferase, family 25
MALNVAALNGAHGGNLPLSSPEMFVINLDRSTERMEQFLQINAHLPPVTRFSAVDGKTVNKAALLDQQIFSPPIFYSDGAIGMTLSRRQLWKMAAERRDYITIFEDDAIVHKEFAARAPAMIAELSDDWDIVLWGWNFDATMSFDILRGVPCLARFSQSELRKQWASIQNDAIRPTLLRQHFCFGTVGYSISPAGAQKIAGRVFPVKPFLYRLPGHNIEIENLTSDCILAVLYNSLNAYVCSRRLSLPETITHLRPFMRTGGDAVFGASAASNKTYSLRQSFNRRKMGSY